MSGNGHTDARKIRAGLKHPIIDADGHWLEFGVLGADQIRKIGGEPAAEGLATARQRIRDSLSATVAERQRRWVAQEAFWAFPTRNTRDRATSMFPRLLYERLDEFGIDFSMLYPTAGLSFGRLADPVVRRATCRAFNVFTADYFREFSDRLSPAAVIPMHTPEEAVEELEYAIRQLGFKIAMFGSLIPRPVPALAAADPEAAKMVEWRDTLGVDSAHDYDPVWQKCVALGVSPTFHTGGRSYGFRNSPTNFVYNHIGHFSSGQEAVCKSLFLAGVTRRFPSLKFAFLEGGVGWACTLYADLVGHWERRNREALENTDPKNLDREMLLGLADKYAGADVAKALRDRNDLFDAEASADTGGVADLDDFSRCRITKKQDIKDLFVPHFYFGCEADDPINAWAFNRKTNPFDARLNTLFGSDIGHFDVPDMADVVPEAHELLEDGLISADDFRDFTFANAVRFWATANPNIFKGTVVEGAAAALSAETPGKG